MSELITRTLLIIVAGIMSSAVQATDLNINGIVVASPCTVDTASVNQDVDFGQVRLNEMRAAGNASDWQSFEVKLVNCPPSTTSATVTFSGTPATADATLYDNAGTAVNAAVQLAQAANKTLVQGNGSSMTVSVDAQHNATYALAGRLMIFSDTGPGTFSSIVQMAFTYQ
ncbi:fimbrial protein [Serratia fonticola]|jgi:minor fimbrial subunit|uniref:fimbrial protein n=1 Tax=Serratia fonticola TaxID=47917 RepID=UPI0021774629|nr:fimbrial protein [Serratia fonticola]CAI0802819.1 fimbrial-like adhesin protein SfmF [Serratia fonticola]CAI0805149.1 fimbrial-like adhesin protein SfmF [Serratia fonticola]CAI1633306.1 fimbrial-like adhesin protein SfmF [Serratia fonticola]CAI1711815.1 fimbrial-like adhesin protein SfmF [Serratia fonticola]CAI1792859.1 fimbrial-like adhesin protein SfmF [Serratia fonticola]